MRILVISQYFYPENFRVNELTSTLVERGHEVTVLTGQPNYPSGKFVPGYGWRGPRSESYGGAQVYRVPLVRRGSASGVRLVLNYLSFVLTACWGVLFGLPSDCRFEAIFVFEPSPITVGIPAALARWRFGAPVLFWVLDLWPESLAAVGALRTPWLLRCVEPMVRWIYRRCDRVLVQSRAFIPEIKRHGIAEAVIRYFPKWGEATFDIPATAIERADLPGVPPGFRVLFAGNVGAAQDFPAIIEAATLLKERADIQWIIVGDGRMAAWAKEETRRRGLEQRVYFMGQHPQAEMPSYFAAADALLLSLKREPIFALTVPGKLQSYLASEKPVLAMLDGEGRRIVDEAHAGLTCEAGDGAGLARAVETLAALSVAERTAMGKSGREYFLEHFARERVFDHLDSWLVELSNL